MKLWITALALVLSHTHSAQNTPILQQETLGSGVSNIANSRLDLKVRNTYEVDPANLDGDGDTDLVYCQFYLFNPPIGKTPNPPYIPVEGTGGIRLLYNKTAGPGGQPELIPGPPYPDGNSSLHYSYMKPSLVDETEYKVVWTPDGTPPSVRDAEIQDLDGDGDVDIILAASVEVDPLDVQQIWLRPEANLAQNRLLLQEGGVFYDQTFGQDYLEGGSGNNADRLPLRASNTCGVAVGDIDGDGDNDIVFAEYGGNFAGSTNVVLLNDGQGHFSQAPGLFFGVARASVDVELGDLNSDGKVDIVFANANPRRESVVVGPPQGPWSLGAAADIRRNEAWLNASAGRTIAFAFMALPDPPCIPDPAAPYPYNQPGFWNDTRSVALGDIDNDSDVDILFANSGWDEKQPDELSNVLVFATQYGYSAEHYGQPSQLLLNMGGTQSSVVPKPGGGTLGLADYLDVGYYALPYSRADHMSDPNPDGTTTPNPTGGIRVLSDFELTGAQDVGRPSDLTINYAGGSTSGLPQNPVPDGYKDLLVIRGQSSLSTVLINSANWSMIENPVGSGQWFTKGRFFRGDIQLNSDWSQPANALKSLWEVQPWDVNGDDINDRGPFTGQYARFEFSDADRLYATDGDWADLDNDGRLDVVMANSEAVHGQINGVFLYRKMTDGFRWKGPSDEGAVMPYVNSLLSYGVDAGDVDADGDIDIVVAGVPSALALENQGGIQGGTEGVFKEHTFQDVNGGWLPMTGHAPLYAPLLTESVLLFDAEGDHGPLEMLFVGYPSYDSLGKQFHFRNEAKQWHYYDTEYYNPITDPTPTAGSPVLPHCTFYTGGDQSGVYQNRTLQVDAATNMQWLDRNGRTRENISDEARAGDFDNDGDEDVVVAYRSFDKAVHSHITSWPSRLDPALHQVVLSLWMNDGNGHLKDEAVKNLGSSWQANGSGADNYFWDALAGDRYEGIGIADVDSDGDLDILTTGTVEGTTSPPKNRLFINMGGNQQSAAGGAYRAGEFRVAGLASGPLASWGGVYNSDVGFSCNEVEAGDFDGDDRPDFAIAGVHKHDEVSPGGAMVGFLLMNAGNGTFTTTDFAQVASPPGPGIALDAWFNHPPGWWDSVFAAEPGDFDGDGDLDVVLATLNGESPRLLENTTADQDHLAFVDRSSVGSAPSEGTASEDGIAWLTGWASDGVVEDFDGDGLHDIYIANVTRTTQDELLLSSAEDPESNHISSAVPAFAITGNSIRIRGVHLAASDTVWFERDTTSVMVAPSAVSARTVDVEVPLSAPLGLCRVYVGQSGSPQGRSNPIQFTHLNAAPVATTFVGIQQGNQIIPKFGFRATDEDGVGDIAANTWLITRTRNSTVTTWSSSSPGPWTYSAGSQQIQLAANFSVYQFGDSFYFEIGDAKAAYGKGSLEF